MAKTIEPPKSRPVAAPAPAADPPRFPVPSAALVPTAPELRFRLSVAQREVDFLRKLLKVVEAADADATPAILLFPANGEVTCG